MAEASLELLAACAMPELADLRARMAAGGFSDWHRGLEALNTTHDEVPPLH